MNVVILGAGVAGITTAYYLSQNGFQVTLVDQWQKSGCGSSYGNGGQLSYNYATPIANPQVLRQLPKILLGLDPAFKVSPSLDFNFYLWGLRYLYQCLPVNSRQSASLMKQLGLLAKSKLADIIEQTNIHFDLRRQAGKIYLYQCLPKSLSQQSKQDSPLTYSRSEVFSLIAGLAPSVELAGGLLDLDEDAADSHKFCLALTHYLQNYAGVKFLANHKILSASTDKGRITAIQTDRGVIKGDCYILSMGPQSYSFARTLGMRLPIYPMKGYSVTVPATSLCPEISVTDTANKTVYCKLGDRLRIAGFAEFSGYSTEVKQGRIDSLIKNARELLPQAGDYDHILDRWCGLRPATPDSLPIVGQSAYENLLLNTGHGMLGWTHSAATADMICHILLNQPHELDLNLLSINRFSLKS